MAEIKGITVTLYDKIKVGADPFGNPLYEETPVEIENVLVSPSVSADIVDTLDLNGKKGVYTLAIPKGDTHEWADRKVNFFGRDWKTFGFALGGIEELIPLEWNKKIQVEAYE